MRINLDTTRGNLTRIDNVLNQMPERLKNVEAQLQTLYAQVEAAKAELGKPFPQEAELRQKSERLAELNTLLDMDGKGSQERTAGESAVAKSSRPSVLEKLRSMSASEPPHSTKNHHRTEEIR